MSFYYKKENLGDARLQFEVELDNQVIQKNFNEISIKYLNQVAIPGFRKGKVPSQILKKKFGEDIKLEVFRLTISEVLDEILNKENVQFIGDPKFENIPELLKNLVEGQGLKFNFEVEEYSKLDELAPYEKLEISILEKPKTVDPEDVEKIVKKLQFDQSKLQTKVENKIEKEDIIQIQYYFYFLENGDQVRENSHIYNFNLSSDDGLFFSFKEKLIGLKRSDEETFLFENLSELENYVSVDFFKKKNQKEVYIHIKIMDIYTCNFCPIDDELAKDYHCDSLEELKRLILNKLNLEVEEENEKIIFNSILEKIIQNSKFSIGNQFINMQIQYHVKHMNEKVNSLNITFDNYLANIKKSYNDYIQELKNELVFSSKYQFVYAKLLQEIPMEVEKKEIEEEVKKYLDTFDYHHKNFSELFKEIEKNPAEYDSLKKKILMKKLFRTLVQKNIINYN